MLGTDDALINVDSHYAICLKQKKTSKNVFPLF